MKLSDFMALRRLSKRRLRSEKDYREFQAFQARCLVSYMTDRGVEIRGRTLFDLGSGIAGYSQEFAQRGARVVSIDLVHPRDSRIDRLSQVQASAMAIPLRNEVADVVFCASLIEHVAEPQAVLVEIERILRRGGVSYVSFPPYYSPMGGHEFSPFHYLGERLAIRLARRHAVVPEWARQLYQLPDQVHSFSALAPGWGLYKMTVRGFRHLLARTGLVCTDMSTRYMPFSFVRWPLLGEVLTWHAQFLLAKPPLAVP